MSIFKRMKEKFTGDAPHSSHDAISEPTFTAEQYVEQAWSCRNNNDWAGAVNNFNRAIELNPYDASCYYGRGVVHCILGNNWKAMVDLDKAIGLDPNHAMALTERALVNQNLGEPLDALADLDEALRCDPAYLVAHHNMGVVNRQLGRLPEAIANYDLALRMKPYHWDSYLIRAVVYANLGENQLAYEDCMTYLQHNPKGPHVAMAKEILEKLSALGEYEAPEWSLRRWMWSEFVLVDLFDSVDELIQKVQTAKAYFVVVPLSDGQYALESVYSRLGLRFRLTEIADVIGREILRMRLCQFHDLWKPSPSVGPTATEAQVKQSCKQNNGCALVLDSEEIIGVLSDGVDYVYPPFATVLFGKAYTFAREGRKGRLPSFRQCPACEGKFAYYKPVLEDDRLVDYACPHCGESPTTMWVEERMRPGRFSVLGFLGINERLEDVVGRDEQTLRELGVDYEQIADALDRLLGAATSAHEDQVANQIERQKQSAQNLASRIEKEGIDSLLIRNPTDLPKSGHVRARQSGSDESIESMIVAGRLPPEDVGHLIDGYQIFLAVYYGYQHCPWTAIRRPWSMIVPAEPTEVNILQGITHIGTVPGKSLPCKDGVSYRYADRDFLILDRSTGQYLKGPGLIVHLIREHHFFEGLGSPYRVDPEQAARVLRLI